MTQSYKIVFFGNERLSSGYQPSGAPTLEALIKNGYQVALVVTNFQPGRSRSARPLEIQQVAEKHGIPLLAPEKLSDINQQLVDAGANAGVLVAYGKIIPQDIIDIFPRGIINIHPSLLPKYRGPTPVEQAILDGASQTGTSLMQLVKKMDAGPVFAQAAFKLHGHETKQELTSNLANLGIKMLISELPKILSGTAKPVAQDESQASYCQLLSKTDGLIDTSKPANIVEREIRAFSDWPKSRLKIFGVEIIVKAARVAANSSDGSFVINCGNNTFLEITQVTSPNGRNISGADFLRGYQKT